MCEWCAVFVVILCLWCVHAFPFVDCSATLACVPPAIKSFRHLKWWCERAATYIIWSVSLVSSASTGNIIWIHVVLLLYCNTIYTDTRNLGSNNRQTQNKSIIAHCFNFCVDFVLAIGFICAKIKYFVNMTTRNAWYLHRLAIIRCWNVMQITWRKIHRHIQRMAVAITLAELATSLAIHRHTQWWQWRHNRLLLPLQPPLTISNSIFQHQNYNTTTIITITILMGLPMVVTAVWQRHSLTHRCWKFRTALKGDGEKSEEIYRKRRQRNLNWSILE